MEQAFNPANQDHPLAYFYAFILVIRCCFSGLFILLVCFSNSQPVSLQKYSGQGDVLPHIVFAFQTLSLLLLWGDANLSVFYFCIWVHMWQLCVWSPQSHTVIVPQGKRATKTYGAREIGVLHCSRACFRDNRLWYFTEKIWLPKIF